MASSIDEAQRMKFLGIRIYPILSIDLCHVHPPQGCTDRQSTASLCKGSPARWGGTGGPAGAGSEGEHRECTPSCVGEKRASPGKLLSHDP